MSAPLVSIVTPCLNPGRRLERCIASVRDQTYRQVEHVVVDGGSTDGTIDVLRESAVRWISERDSGQADAINKGFRMATGVYLGWLNADDVLKPRAVELVVEGFRRTEGVGWVLGDVEVVEGDGRRRERPAKIDRPRTWAARNLAAQPGSFHSRSMLERVGFLDESFHYMMDCDLWLRMVDAGVKHVYIPEVLAVFEVHGGSKSGALDHSVFLVEETRARMKSGRFESGSAALGRTVAWRLQGRHYTLDEVDREIGEVIRLVGVSPADVSDAAVRAGFAAEVAILRVKEGGLSSLPRALHPRAWSHPASRARMRDVVRRASNAALTYTLRRFRR